MRKDDNNLSFLFYSTGKKEGVFIEDDTKSIKRNSKVREKEKVLKLDAKSKLEDEISEHTTRLGEYLY